MRVVAMLFFTTIISGCATHARHEAPSQSMHSLGFAGMGHQPASLFSGDAAILSDADIDRILKFKYVPPTQTRVGILALGHQLWIDYSDELARSGEEVQSNFINQLKRSPAVTGAAYLPSLLIPKNSSVPFFREAAARYQADSLVIYQSSCRNYEKYRFFEANISKSFCNVEVALLDVRTGIVPFTTTVTQEFVASQTTGDTNIYETMRKAEQTAIRGALDKIANDLVSFWAAK